MVFHVLRLEYFLEGILTFIAWRDRIEVVLEDNGLKEFIDQEVPKPATMYAQNLAEWKKCVAKARWIILEEVQDHIVSSLRGKETPHAMWKTLTYLYENSSDQRKLALKDKLHKIKMDKSKTIPKCLTKFTQCQDELGSVGIIVIEEDILSLDLLGLPRIWHSYQDSINGQEKLSNWEGLWSNFMQDEIRRNTSDGSSSKTDDEENCALEIKASKGKGKISCYKLDSYHGDNKKDMMKVKCFHSHKMGHFATNCLLKKSK